MSGTRLQRLAATAASVALVATGAVVVAPTAQAAANLAPCTWEAKDRANTFNCGKPTTRRPSVPIVDCWKHQPSDRTYVQRKSGAGWVKANVKFSIREGQGCSEAYPWRTVLRLPTGDLSAYEVGRYRLIMPATSGTDDQGEAWEYGKTVVDFNICLVQQKSTKTC